MHDQKLYMIGNAHLDPVWQWQWQEGFQEIKATFRSALDRLAEYPDFVFTSTSAAYYEWVEQNDPAMFREIQARVAEGRWQIVGGWWVQPDCNIPGGESFVRQALYAQRYFREKFGVIARVGYCVDSFGHSGMLPQILKKSGMDGYVFMRPGPHEKGLASPVFWWEADDGSRVLAFRILYEYCTWGRDLEKHIRRCAAELKPPLSALMCFYGVGNHGGGPTRENIESIHRLQGEPDLPELVLAAPNDFFAEFAGQERAIPVVHEDLQHHAVGCYAAHSGIKRWNRQAENLLLAAEKFSSIASRATGQPYPRELKQAWKNVLFNQFHDILAGTSIEAAYEDARDSYGEAMTIANRALNHAVQSLAWNIRIPVDERTKPIVVFNPHPWPAQLNVELEFGRWAETDLLMDDTDRPVPVQRVQSQATAQGRNRLSFIADLPPLGYRTYRVIGDGRTKTDDGGRRTDQESAIWHATDTTVENGFFRLELDAASGFIKRLHDKRAGAEVFMGDAARPVVLDDPSDTWSHNVFRYDRACGEFRAQSVRLVEWGPVKAVIRAVSGWGASRLIQDFTMYRDLEPIDVHVTVDWREQFKALKLRFPVNVTNMEATYEISYGHIERLANGDEEPGQGWVDVTGLTRESGTPYGLSILNDGKYSFDVNVRDIGLTVLRSPIYSHHLPLAPDPDGHYSFMDQGQQQFTYTLLPHRGGWEEAGTVRRAAELNQRPIALVETFHPRGELPQCDSFASVDEDHIVISVLKQAEDGGALILRAYETAQTEGEATISLPHWKRMIRTHFKPCEIKTFRIPRDETQPVVETDLLEW